MTIFTDDFQRANGALGGNWVTVSGSPVIVSGNVAVATGWRALDTTVSTDGRIEATANVFRVESTTIRSGPVVKMAQGLLEGFWAGVDGQAEPYRFAIRGTGSHTGTILASVNLVGIPGPYLRIRIAWDNGNLSAWLNDVLLIEYFDVSYAANLYAGLAGGGAAAGVADVRIVTGSELAFDVTPNIVGNFGSPVELSLLGVGTAWTAGTPGDPIFLISQGTITAQTVADATHATLTVNFGTYLGPVTITDPSTGATDTIMVTSDPAYLPGFTGQLSAEAVAYLERSAIAEASPTIANREMIVSESGPSITLSSGVNQIHLSVGDKTYAPGGEAGTNALAYLLWQLINGGYDPAVGPWQEPPSTPIAQNVGAILTAMATLITVNDYTLGDVIVTLAGEGVPTHKDIMDAVGALDAPDLQPVLDAIAALRGDEIATVAGVAAQLDTIRSIGDYTLASVRTWVEGVRGTDQPTIHDVLDAIAALNNAPATDLAPVLSAVGGVDTVVDLIIAALTAYLVPELATVGTILDAIDAIEIPEPASGGAPVWPGVENVTLGEPVELADGVVITGPMHGLLLNVTGHPSGSGKFAFGSIRSWRYLGAVLFVSDNGDAEWPSQIGPEQQVIAPRHMAMAASAVFRLNAGFTGTVTPWLVTGGA